MSPPGREDTSREHDTGSTQEKDMDTSPCDSDFGEEGLRDNLYSFLLENKSQFDKTPHEFLPRDKLDGIFSAQSKQGQDQTRNVFKPMGINSTSPTNEDLSLTEYILNNCQKLYLIAVFIELKPKPLRTLMSIFRQNEFTDKKLPIDMWGANEIKAGIRKPPFHPLVVMEKQYEPTRTLRIWDLISISKFQKEQWKFLIPTISTKEILHDFGQHTIPFSVKHEFEGKGGNGIVHKYEIHHAHFEDTSPPIKSDESSRVISAQRLMSNVVAVKQIRKEGKEVARRCEKEVRALAKMNSFNHKHIVRFVTSFRRQGTSGGIEHYVIFEWADGGNLTDFRAAHPNPEMTVELVKWTIQQLCGLAQALAKAHYLDDDGSYRHGDLKPANILWFKQGDTKFGTLKIGDWGEAKEHYNGTALRHNTTAQCGTRRYEPPEVQTGLKLKLSGGSRFVRSRLYDIWGIGCITLEILIWLMYGLGELKRFERESAGTYGASDLFYEVSSGKPAKVHGNVEHWMSEMAVDPRCFPDKTALGDLLKIVRTGLLIVKLPREGGIKRPHGPSDHVSETLESKSNKFRSSASATKTLDTGHSDTPSIQVTEPVEDEVTKALEDPTLASPGEARRCLATDFEDGLQKILANDQDESYWFSGDASKPAPHAFRRPDFLSAEAGAIASTRDAPSHWYNGTAQIDYGTKNPVDLETWNFEYDNDFARLMFSRWNDVRLSPPKAAPVSNMLCHQCMGICGRVSNPYFEETYEVAKLKWSKGTCDLCNMFWNAQEKFPRTPSSSKVKFHRQMGSYMIMMDGLKSPVLTLFRNNGKKQLLLSILI
jgi:serine/threonine protein kinase